MNIEAGEGSFVGYMENLLANISQMPLGVARVVSQRLQGPRNGAPVFGSGGSYPHELYHQLPVSCFVMDTEGRILDVNQAWCESLGYAAAEAINRGFADFVLPEEVPAFEKGFSEMLAAGRVEGCRFTARRKNGQNLGLLLNGKRVNFSEEAGTGFCVCALQALPANGTPLDITPISARGRGSLDQDSLLSIIESSDVPIWMVDRECCLVLGSLAFYQSYESCFGYTPRPGEPIFPKNVEVEYFAEWQGCYSRALGGEKHSRELAMADLTPPRYVECQFNPVLDDRRQVTGVSVTAHDVTTRRMIEEALRETNDRLLATLDSIDDGFIAMDHALVVKYFNQAAGSLLNRKVEDVIDRYFFDAFPELEGSILEEQFLNAIFEGATVASKICFVASPQANWYDVRLYPHQNGLTVFIGTVTEQQGVEEQLCVS